MWTGVDLEDLSASWLVRGFDHSLLSKTGHAPKPKGLRSGGKWRPRSFVPEVWNVLHAACLSLPAVMTRGSILPKGLLLLVEARGGPRKQFFL